MGRIMRNITAGGKPKTSTPKDKRLKSNKTSTGKKAKDKPAKVTHGF